MMPSSSGAECSAEDYQKYLAKIIRRYSSRMASKNPTWISASPVDVTGLNGLLNSFATGSLRNRGLGIEEWNPFSQRPVFDLLSSIRPGLDSEYERVSSLARQFVTVAHEGMHVLLWEPFFTGFSKPHKRDFRGSSLAFEGFCFWYADVFLTPKLQLRLPDGEFIYDRCTISQGAVHPSRALQRIGVLDSEQKSMQLYIKTFQGHKTKYFTHLKDPIVRNMANRFYSFYQNNDEGPRAMFRLMQAAGIFDEFFERFCRLKNMPQLLPSEILKMPYSRNPAGYCWSVFTKGMKFIEKADRNEIRRVQLRRSIQTRAYFAFCLRYLLDNRLVASSSKPAISRVRVGLGAYLDQLQITLQKLSAVSGTQGIDKLIESADHIYTREVRALLQKSHSWVGAREQIYPHLSAHTQISINGDWTELPNGKLKLFATEVFDNIVVPSLDLQTNRNQSMQLAKICLALAAELKSNKFKRQSVIRGLNKALANELVFKNWSVPLDVIDPQANNFREILFRYS